jgi:hypothetical protein
MDEPRIITEREMFDMNFAYLHSTCMDMACKEAIKCSETHHIPIDNFDISALTFQLFKMWVDNRNYLQSQMVVKQNELDKHFKQK